MTDEKLAEVVASLEGAVLARMAENIPIDPEVFGVYREEGRWVRANEQCSMCLVGSLLYGEDATGPGGIRSAAALLLGIDRSELIAIECGFMAQLEHFGTALYAAGLGIRERTIGLPEQGQAGGELPQ